MIRTHIQVKGLEEVRRAVTDVQRKQIPFATANALNAVLIDAQTALRDREFDHAFKLRRPDFIYREGAKRLGPAARKDRQFVTLGTSDRADFLDKFTTGGIKHPTQGRTVAVPGQVRRNKRDLITKGNRPRSLLDKKSRFFAVHAEDRDPRVAHLTSAPGIYGRFGGKRKPRLRLMYGLERGVKIAAVLHYARTVERTVNEKWSDRFAEAFRKALTSPRDAPVWTKA